MSSHAEINLRVSIILPLNQFGTSRSQLGTDTGADTFYVTLSIAIFPLSTETQVGHLDVDTFSLLRPIHIHLAKENLLV